MARTAAVKDSVGEKFFARDENSSKPFRLVRWFSLVSLLCIALVSGISSVMLSNFLTNQMLQRDAEVSMQFVQSIADVQNARTYFLRSDYALPDKNLEEFFSHISTSPDVLRANVYARDGRIVWSSDRALIGQKFGANADLDKALQGHLEFETGIADWHGGPKPEHINFGDAPVRFVELYLPVRDMPSGSVIGVVEVYKTPTALFATISSGVRLIWVSAITGGLLLYLALFWLIRRANRIIINQQERLVESETLAVVGEMATVIAHGIRNPLASIRSSAELCLTESEPSVREAAEDITHEADRLEKWVRELLTYSQSVSEEIENVEISEVINQSVNQFSREMKRRNVSLYLSLPPSLPLVRGSTALLSEVFNNVFANALDAMPDGGELALSGGVNQHLGSVLIHVSDTGIGMQPAQLERVFVPFYTTKIKGVGLGLALVKRILRRLGGDIDLTSEASKGTTVNLRLALATEP
jgi:two-component system, NtrC family, sensor histidine kinase HydH